MEEKELPLSKQDLLQEGYFIQRKGPHLSKCQIYVVVLNKSDGKQRKIPLLTSPAPSQGAGLVNKARKQSGIPHFGSPAPSMGHQPGLPAPSAGSKF